MDENAAKNILVIIAAVLSLLSKQAKSLKKLMIKSYGIKNLVVCLVLCIYSRAISIVY